MSRRGLPVGLLLVGAAYLWAPLVDGFVEGSWTVVAVAIGMFVAAAGAWRPERAKRPGLLVAGFGIAAVGACAMLVSALGRGPDVSFPGTLLVSLSLAAIAIILLVSPGATGLRRSTVPFAVAGLGAVWYLATELLVGLYAYIPGDLLAIAGFGIATWGARTPEPEAPTSS